MLDEETQLRPLEGTWRLERLDSTHQNMRTPTMIGTVPFAPECGFRFRIMGDPIDTDLDIRIITTSVVQSILIDSDAGITFKTLNSTYRLTKVEGEIRA